MSSAALITDLDNTIYNWVDYFAPCFRVMVHVLARELEVSEDALYDAFRDVYARHRSLEYAFSVQELSLCADLPRGEVERLARVAKGAFSRVREKNLQPYEGVEETLEWAVGSGLVVVGVTNAPVENAKGRLRQLGIDQYFAALAALDSPDPPDDGLELTKEIARKAKEGRYGIRVPEERICRLQENELKPSPAAYTRALEAVRFSGDTVYVVGDSIEKDLKPATELGYTTILANYGAVVSPKNFETLLRITHWSDDRIESTYSRRTIQPDFEIQSFAELPSILEAPQLSLFRVAE